MWDLIVEWNKTINQKSKELENLLTSLDELEGHYVHIPFCRKLCPYCAFVKTRLSPPALRREFLIHLKRQVERFLLFWDPQKTKTLYLGGGTPTQLPLDMLAEIRSWFGTRVREATIEINPMTGSNLTMLKHLKEMGFNRVSLGAQSLNNDTLKQLGREHTYRDIIHTIEAAKSLDFIVQVDLIFGVQTSNSRSFIKELETLSALDVTGFSLYSLTLEPGTPWASCTQQASEEQALKEYSQLVSWFQGQKWFPYEVSHWSQTIPWHNFLYWTGRPYFGYGPGAHGLVPPYGFHAWGRRYKVGLFSTDSNWEWKNDLLTPKNQSFLPTAFEIVWDTVRTFDDHHFESRMTQARTTLGILPPVGWDQNPKIQKGLAEGHLIWREGYLVIHPAHWMISNTWIEALV